MIRLILGSLAALLLVQPVVAQTFSNDRIGMNRYVRGLVQEPQTTYLPDTTLNRIIFYAHRTTAMALGEYTDIDIDTIVSTQGKHEYALAASGGSEGAMVGRVAGVSRRRETNQGGGDVGFVEVDFSQIGKLGEGTVPNSYTVKGEHLVLGTTPMGGDTLFVYYMPLPNDLDGDAEALTVTEEDFEAVAMLAAAKVKWRDHQVQVGGMYYQVWKDLVAMKRRDQGQGAPQ
jgi:hypothetical protein